jgi:hypothetical protein
MSRNRHWLILGERLITPLLRSAMECLEAFNVHDLHVATIPSLALLHLATCLDTSIRVNKEGHYAVALCFTRQCIKALTLVEFGFLDPSYSDPFIKAWAKGRKSHGDLRREFETVV